MSQHRPGPRLLLLDVMGTLVHDPYFHEMPGFFGMTLAELQAVQHPTRWIDFELGRVDEATYLAEFFRDGRPLDGEALLACLRSAYRLLPGIEALLDELKAAGVEMHALSNYAPWYCHVEAACGLSRWLRWSFVSCETGVRKPDASAFEGALRHLRIEPSEAAFVDDQPANVAAAETLGIPSLVFDGASGLRRGLSALGLGLDPAGGEV